MPISPQAQQLAALMAALQQMGAQQQQKMMVPAAQQMPSQALSPAMSAPGISALTQGLSGAANGGGTGGSQPPTLGIGNPMPMQMPNPDPQGQQQQPPINPFLGQ